MRVQESAANPPVLRKARRETRRLTPVVLAAVREQARGTDTFKPGVLSESRASFNRKR